MYLQLAEHILELKKSGMLLPGSKLPPIRRFAECLGVNNVTVVNAYKHLESRKILKSHVGRGTFVANEALFSEYDSGRHNDVYEAFDLHSMINFAKSAVSADLFPTKAFRDAFNSVLDRDLGLAFSYPEARGYTLLRKEICKDLKKQSIKASVDEVQVISGTQQGIDIVSKVLLKAGDVVIAERPASYNTMGAFQSRGARIVQIDMLEDGMDLEKLEQQLKNAHPKLIYIASRFQIPTCYSYSLEKKQKLLSLAAIYDTYILEEDNRSEFVYSGVAEESVKALDTEGRVIYVKSYSQVIIPGVNIGFMAYGEKAASAFADNIASAAVQGFMQRAFAQILANGEYYRHVEDMRKVFKTRYETAISAIDENLCPNVEYKKPSGGLNIWLKIKDKNINVQNLAGRLLKENVVITPGALYDMESKDIPYIRLSLSGVDEDDIEIGIKKIAHCMKY